MGASDDLGAALTAAGVAVELHTAIFGAVDATFDLSGKGGGSPVAVVDSLTASRRAAAGLPGVYVVEIELGEGRGSIVQLERVRKDARQIDVSVPVFVPAAE